MIRDDYKAYNLSPLGLVKGLFTGHTFYAVLAYRFGSWLHRHKIKFFPDVVKYRILRKFACEISPYAKIGKGLRIFHTPGVVIGHDVVMGEFCEIFQNVTIGSNRREKDGRLMPQIGDRVVIGAGATVVGAIRIGSDVTIGAGSFVNKDVPDGVVVAGVPARIIRENNKAED